MRSKRRPAFLCAVLLLAAACEGSIKVGDPNIPAWTLLSSTSVLPPARLGGTTLVGLTAPILYAGDEAGGPASDLWVFGAGATWTQLEPTGGPPVARDRHGAIFDPATDRMMIFGGCLGGCLPVASDYWVLANADGAGGTPAWTRLSPTGSVLARQSFAMAYDSANNVAIVFGGQNGGGNGGATLPDVSVLTHANGLGGAPAWTQLQQSGMEAPGQYGPAWGYDSANAKLIVMGGDAAGSGAFTNAVYVLSNANGVNGATATWTNVVAEGAAGAPPVGQLRPAAYDGANNRFIEIGGVNPGDVWLLSNANGTGGPAVWAQFAVDGGPGAGFRASGNLYNPATGTLTVLFAGTASGSPVNQLWQLSDARSWRFP